MPTTKPWNIKPEDLPADLPEVPVYDYEDQECTRPCGMKFKTKPDRFCLWVHAHRREFSTASWEKQTDDTITMRTGRANKEFGSIVVKFHITSQIILIQGKAHANWQSRFSVLLDMVNKWTEHEDLTTYNDISSLDFCRWI